MQQFEVIEASGSEMILQLIFDRPEIVTDDDEIEISLDFSFLKRSDAEGFNYKVPLVKLNVEVEEVEEEWILSPQGVATSVALLGTIKIAIGNGSLAQLWGMINGIQLGVYLPLTNVLIPDNANKFT